MVLTADRALERYYAKRERALSEVADLELHAGMAYFDVSAMKVTHSYDPFIHEFRSRIIGNIEIRISKHGAVTVGLNGKWRDAHSVEISNECEHPSYFGSYDPSTTTTKLKLKTGESLECDVAAIVVWDDALGRVCKLTPGPSAVISVSHGNKPFWYG